jgi:penicillin-binding protein 2
MERRIRVRVTALIVMILLIVGLFGFRLYDVQGTLDEEAQRKANSIAYKTYVDAARGPILDRNGNVLVTNRASYDLVIINFVWSNSATPNQSLMTLLKTCRDLGLEVESHFPVSRTKPYEYTLEEQSEVWQSYFRQFLTARGWDPDITARVLMENLREDYRIPDSWSTEDAYELIRVRYELELRSVENMPLDNYVLAKDVTSQQLSAVMELGVPGVIVETSTVREYKTPYLTHILGFTGLMDPGEYENLYREQGYFMDAVVGKEGVEAAFEQYLHGTSGIKYTRVTSTGEVLEEYWEKTPQPGSAVELTIDIGLQAVGEEALKSTILALQENGVGSKQEGRDACAGAVVMTECKTGDVLVSASYPTYDLSTFRANYNDLLNDPTSPLMNRALLAEYSPGSIFKMATAIAAMDKSSISRYFPVEDKGLFLKYADYSYTPACYIYTSTHGAATHGTVNMMQALRDSCNYYFYEVGLMVNSWDLDEVSKTLGLGEPTGVELAENIGTRGNPDTKAAEYAGTDQAAWVDGDKLQTVIGQGLNHFTPLQMANYTAAIANEGVRMKATFLSRVVSWDYQTLLVENNPEIAAVLEMSEEAKLCIEEGMLMAAETGTAYTFLKDYPIKVAAKTGTAQHGSGGSDNCSFVCYAPADDPEVAIAIYVEKGAQGGNLGQIAVKLLDAYFAQSTRYETTTGENTVG